jgi:hypothetical protein
MCRIDAPFGNRLLNEKTDPVERFIQVLDEYGANGSFRSLLTKHFSNNWMRVFSDVASLEEALRCAQQHDSDPEKFTAFLLAYPVIDRLRSDLGDYVIELHFGASRKTYPRLDFAIDGARNFFPKSAYGLFSSGLDKALRTPYDRFVSVFYGEDFCFSRAFFDDEALTSLHQRTTILWQFFSVITSDTQRKNLISAASLSVLQGPPTRGEHRGAHDFLRGIEFLKSWVKYDAKAGRLGSDDETLLEKIDRYWQRDLVSSLQTQQLSGEALELAEKWLSKTRRELKTAYYLCSDLTSAPDQDIERWAKGLDKHFDSYSSDCLDIVSTPYDELIAHEIEYLDQLNSQLSPLQIETWIQWAVKVDFESVLKSGKDRLNKSEKWRGTKHSAIWKEKFLAEYHDLDMESRLSILSSDNPFPRYDPDEEDRGLWNSLLRDLIKKDGFPTKLIPRWAISTRDKLDREERTPYIDKSIGILRGELSKDAKPEHHEHLNQLLEELDRLARSKALRHRLMLMRSSKVPFSDESISRFSSFDTERAVEWYLPLEQLANDWFAHQENRKTSAALLDREKSKKECFETLSHELAEFCLSRLRLRKGEKAKDGKYCSDQVTETSPIWRQGYLKTLEELGFDLNGKVHKTVHFTKQSDPDEGVRGVAKDCYRSVRRDTKKKSSIEDLKRGIIAAEWWLLMSQRRELNEIVNHEEALKTRRRLLRNP